MSASEANTPRPQPTDHTGGFTVFPPVPSAILRMLNSSSTTASATVITLGPNQPKKDGPLPASKKSIADMPVVNITEGMDLDDDAEVPSSDAVPSCAICLGEYEVGGEAKEMPCMHIYHPECIDKWLRVHGTCPVCRYEMPVEEEKKRSKEARRRERGEVRITRIFFQRSNEGGATEDLMEID